MNLEHTVQTKLQTLDIPEIMKEMGKLVVLKDLHIPLIDSITLKQGQLILKDPSTLTTVNQTNR